MVGGPGPRKLVHADAGWYLLVGDKTALPAISGNIELLPQTARGTAVIEIIDEADIQDLQKPSHLTVEWVVNPHPGKESHLLVDRVKSLKWSTGKPSVWAACEFATMRQLRAYFRTERGLDSSNFCISSYWKTGSNEESHKVAKREDATAVVFA